MLEGVELDSYLITHLQKSRGTRLPDEIFTNTARNTHKNYLKYEFEIGGMACLAASMPFISGISMSMSTMS